MTTPKYRFIIPVARGLFLSAVLMLSSCQCQQTSNKEEKPAASVDDSSQTGQIERAVPPPTQVLSVSKNEEIAAQKKPDEEIQFSITPDKGIEPKTLKIKGGEIIRIKIHNEAELNSGFNAKILVSDAVEMERLVKLAETSGKENKFWVTDPKLLIQTLLLTPKDEQAIQFQAPKKAEVKDSLLLYSPQKELQDPKFKAKIIIE